MSTEQERLLQEALEAQAGGSGDEEGYDLSDVEEQSFEALPAGWYVATPIECKLERVKNGDNKGAPKFVIRWKIEGTNKPVFTHLILTGKSAGWTKGKLKAMGVDVTATVTPSAVTSLDAVAIEVAVSKNRSTDNDINAFSADPAKIAEVRAERGDGVDASDLK